MQKAERCNPRLRENPAPPPLLFPFFSRAVQGCLASGEVRFWFSIICICSVPQDFYPGGPISILKAPQVRGQRGIFPVNILWATPGKGNQQPLLPVFTWILGANSAIFYSSMISWGPEQNWKCHTIEYLLLLRTRLCQTQFSGLEISFMPLASRRCWAWHIGTVADCLQPPQRGAATNPEETHPRFSVSPQKVFYPAFPITFLFKEIQWLYF